MQLDWSGDEDELTSKHHAVAINERERPFASTTYLIMRLQGLWVYDNGIATEMFTHTEWYEEKLAHILGKDPKSKCNIWARKDLNGDKAVWVMAFGLGEWTV
jgi:hypothetical protein